MRKLDVYKQWRRRPQQTSKLAISMTTGRAPDANLIMRMASELRNLHPRARTELAAMRRAEPWLDRTLQAMERIENTDLLRSVSDISPSLGLWDRIAAAIDEPDRTAPVKHEDVQPCSSSDVAPTMFVLVRTQSGAPRIVLLRLVGDARTPHELNSRSLATFTLAGFDGELEGGRAEFHLLVTDPDE